MPASIEMPGAPEMLIADAQVHIWGPDTPQRPWTPGLHPHRDTPLGAEELAREMDAAGVHRAILIPPSWDGGRNDLVLKAAQDYPGRYAVMGRLDLSTPAPPGTIAKWREQPGMLGLRCSFNRDHEAAALVENRVDWLWAEAEANHIPIMIFTSSDRLHLIDKVAERYPALRLTLSHLTLPMWKQDDEAFGNLHRLLALARRPNIAVKASALPAYTSDSYPYRRLHPHLRRVYDAFGPRRMFWGTDLARIPSTYRQAVTMMTEEIPWLTAEDQEWIMGRGLCEWLRWKY